MQFQPFEPGIEILGHSISFVSAGFRIVPSIGVRFLAKHGLMQLGPGGKMTLDPDAWYPQAAWLAAFEDISHEVGSNVLSEIGKELGAGGRMPPGNKSLADALHYLDAGYHSYHRKRGKIMFDQATGKMLEGIGHYGCQPVKGQNRIISVCENPYPCRFDFGVLSGFTVRFQPGARVLHDDRSPCREKGADSCTYIVSW